MTSRIFGVFAFVAVLAGCGSQTERTWGNADDISVALVTRAETVAEGDDWRFQIGLDPGDRRRCLQLVVAHRAIGCIPVNAEGYGFSATTRVGDERVIWSSRSTDNRPAVDHYVVWSSVSPDGRRVEPVIREGVVNLLWIMEPGEAPWGYQSVAADGTLLADRSFVGLSEN